MKNQNSSNSNVPSASEKSDFDNNLNIMLDAAPEVFNKTLDVLSETYPDLHIDLKAFTLFSDLAGVLISEAGWTPERLANHILSLGSDQATVQTFTDEDGRTWTRTVNEGEDS
jgi:hypothetical protein